MLQILQPPKGAGRRVDRGNGATIGHIKSAREDSRRPPILSVLTAAVAAWVPCPLTVWIAGSVAAAATAILILALWFDRLFEAPGAVRVSSLIEHLNARSVLAVFAHPDDETLAYRVVEPAVEGR